MPANAMSEANPYDPFMLDHIKNARNYRAIDAASHRAAGVNPLCGDELKVYASIVNDRIKDVGFQCSCCGISMASTSVMTEAVKSHSVDEARAAARAFIAAMSDEAADVEKLSAPQRALLDAVRALPARRKCAALGWLTLEAALDGRTDAVSTD